MYDTYVKIKHDEKELKIAVIDLPFYCTCPCCGKEVELPEYMELITENEDYDPYDLNVYCDECAEKGKNMRTSIKEIVNAVDYMPNKQLNEVYNLLSKYAEFIK